MTDKHEIQRGKRDDYTSDCRNCSWSHYGGTSTKPALDHARATGHHAVCTRETTFHYDGHPAGD